MYYPTAGFSIQLLYQHSFFLYHVIQSAHGKKILNFWGSFWELGIMLHIAIACNETRSGSL